MVICMLVGDAVEHGRAMTVPLAMRKCTRGAGGRRNVVAGVGPPLLRSAHCRARRHAGNTDPYDTTGPVLVP